MKRQIKLKGNNVQVIQGYMSGQSVPSLAELYDVTEGAVYQLLKLNNVTLRPKHNFDELTCNAIAQEYAEGTPVKVICKNYKTKISTVHKILSNEGVSVRKRGDLQRRYTVNHSFFDVIDTEHKAYFLGMLYADGYNGQKWNFVSLGLHKDDVALMIALREAIGSDAPFITSRNLLNLRLYSERLSMRLAELGCMQAKSLKLTFPDHIPAPLLHHFVRGYFDGDGTISNFIKSHKSGLIGFLGTLAFTRSLGELIERECGVPAYYKPHWKTAAIQSVEVYGSLQVKVVVDYLYRDATIYLERKKLRADAIAQKNYHLIRRGKDKRPRLTRETAEAIRAELLSGKSTKEIAQQFDSTIHIVQQIRQGRIWR